eukprot:767444-Hanusia_phi.AAC.15
MSDYITIILCHCDGFGNLRIGRIINLVEHGESLLASLGLWLHPSLNNWIAGSQSVKLQDVSLSELQIVSSLLLARPISQNPKQAGKESEWQLS